jgi:hypothetical protein
VCPLPVRKEQRADWLRDQRATGSKTCRSKVLVRGFIVRIQPERHHDFRYHALHGRSRTFTDVGFIGGGRLIAKGSPRELKQNLAGHLLELQVEPAMTAMFELRKLPGVYGVDLRSGNLRLAASDPGALPDPARPAESAAPDP